MRSQFVRRPEFPELVTCLAVPSLDGEEFELRIEANEGPAAPIDVVVHASDMIWVNMPVVPAEAPNFVHEIFAPRGLVLAACRIVERQPDQLIIEVATTTEPARVSITPKQLARRRSLPAAS